VKKRLFFLIVGYWCLKTSVSVFPTFERYSQQILLQKLVFEPFKWFGAILLFILGFLAIARVIKEICEQMKKNQLSKERLWIVLIALIYIYIGFQSIVVALAAIGFSLFYGIMDAETQRKSRYYNS
jgi:putative Mn2+ efflux pump MntP